MADLQKTVAIIFNAVDNTGSALTSIGDNIQGFSSGIQNVAGPLADLGDMVLKANVAIVGLGAAMIGVAINEAGKFQGSINEIGSLFEGTAEQIDAFGQQVLTYSTGSVKSIEDINKAVYSAVSSGVDYAHSLELIATAERLSVAGKADLESTTLALVSTLNAYGESTDQAAKYSDTLFQTVKIGQTTLPELANGLAQVTGIASAAGIPFEDLSSAIAALTAYGLPTSQALTGIKGAISNIIDPAQKAREAAKELGIQFDANALQSKGFAGVLNEVYQATDGNVGKMAQFFGSVEGLNAALTLGKDASGKYAGAITAMGDSAGSTGKAFDIMANNADLLAQKLKNAVDASLIQAGKPLQDEWAQILGAVSEMFQGLSVSFGDGTFAPVFGALEKLLGDLGIYFKKIAAALPEALKQVDFSGLVASFGDLGQSFASIFDGVDLTTPEGLAEAIQFVVDSTESLLEVGAGILAQWGEWSGEIAGLIDSFNDLTDKQKQAAGEALGLSQMLDILFGAVGKIGSGVEALGNAFEAIATVQMAKFITGAGSVREAMAIIHAASSGLSLTLAGATLTGGLVAATGAAAYGVGTVLSSGIDYVVDKLTGSKNLGGLIYDLTHNTEDMGASASRAGPKVAEVAKSMDGLSGATQQAYEATEKWNVKAGEIQVIQDGVVRTVKLSTQAISDWADKQIEAATKASFLKDATDALAVATGKVKEQTEIIADGMSAFSDGISKTQQAMAESAKTYLEAAAAAGTLDAAHKVVREAYDKVHEANLKTTASTTGYKDAANAAALAAQGNAKDMIALAKAAGEYEANMEQIASNERIKVIEAKFSLNIAEVEANAKIAEAILNSLSQTYAADVSLIGDLMAQVTDGYTFADKTRISMALEANQRTEELHGAQMDLIAAQVDYMRAKTDAVSSGNPLVTIQADGLKPHLEAFMWEVLKEIQVKMAYDGGDMLVGGCSL